MGRLRQRSSKVAGKFRTRVEEDNPRAAGLRVVVQEKAEWAQWAASTEGTYNLRSNAKS